MIRQVSAIALARLMGSGAQAVMLIAVARHYGPSLFGYLGVWVAIATVVYEVADMGFNVQILKSHAGGMREHLVVLLRDGGLLFQFIIILLASCTAAVTIMFTEYDWYLALFIAGLGYERLSETRLCLPIAAGQVRSVAASIFFRRTLILAMFFSLLVVGLPATLSVGVAQLVVSISAAAVAMRLAFSVGSLRRRALWSRPDWRELWSGVKESRHYAVANVAATSRMLDTVAVSVGAGAAVAGIYSASNRLLNPFMILPSVVSTSIIPRVSNNGISWMRSRHVQLVLFSIAIFAAFAVISVLGYCLVPIIFGFKFEESALPFAVLSMSMPFAIISSPLAGVLQSLEGRRFVSYTGVLFGLALFPAVFLASFLLGAIGGAIAVLSLSATRLLVLICGYLRLVASERGSNVVSHS